LICNSKKSEGSLRRLVFASSKRTSKQYKKFTEAQGTADFGLKGKESLRKGGRINKHIK